MKENIATGSKINMAHNVNRPLGISIVALLMILFGLAEVVTSFTHNFFGVSTSSVSLFTYSAAAIGLFYVAAGLLVLTMKKWTAKLAIVLLIADIIGRIGLVAAGLYPLNSTEQIFAIIVGTVLAAIFAIYIGLKLKSFE
jgi:hypothetical protein